MEKENYKVCNTDLFYTLTNQDKILFILFDNPNITSKEIANIMLVVSSVSSVSNIKNNSTYFENITNETNKTNKTNKLTTLINNNYMPIKRAIDNNLIKTDKSNIETKYSLTNQAIEQVKQQYFNWKQEIEYIWNKQRNINIKEDQISLAYDFIKLNYEGQLYNNILKEKLYLNIDFLKISKFNPDFAEMILDTPEETINSIKTAIQQLDLPKNIKKIGIKISNTPNSEIKNITDIRLNNLNKLICFVAEINSRSKTHLKATSIRFECPTCGNIMNVLQLENEFKEPSQCGCGRKGKFRIINKEMIDSLKIIGTDIYENLNQHEVPEEIKITLDNDFFNFSSLADGDKIKVTGIVKENIILAKNGKKTNESEKIIQAINIEKLDKNFNNVEITKEDYEKIEEIKKDPLKWYKNIIFSDLHDVDNHINFSIISLYSNLNLLFVGDPGTGKSEIMKRCALTSIKNSITDAINLTKSGLMGTSMKNEFTGKWTIDRGSIRPMHPNGIVAIDEINRDKSFEIQPALLTIMNDKRLRIHRAGAKIDEPCDILIWGTANTFNDVVYDENKSDFKNFGIAHPLWDRFDFKLYFTNNLRLEDEKFVKSMILKKTNTKNFYLSNEQFDLLKKYQIISRNIDVKLNDYDYNKLSKLISKFIQVIDPKASYRALDRVVSLVKGICKLHLRDHTIDSDFVLLSDLLLNVKLFKQDYIISKNETRN